MIRLHKEGIFLSKGRTIIEDTPENQKRIQNEFNSETLSLARQETITARILMAHEDQSQGVSGDPKRELHLNFDALASHDITYVNIIQTAKASGLDEFPVPYVLTNCHNTLCAVGGTINEDDHLFGLSAARRYGGIYVPPHLGVIHTYVRETLAAPGKMILGSDSHTRYGFLGTLGVGEGGGELVKQLLRQTYDVAYPRVIAVYLTGKPRPGVGPQDVALAIIGAVFKDGFVKNAALEFVGDGIASLSADYRAGIDVMTTETACWSSIWETDETVRKYLDIHYREEDYKQLQPGALAYYDGLIYVDLNQIKPMIALPFHPSNVFEIDTLLENPGDIFRQVEKDTADMIENPDVRLHLMKNIVGKKIRVDQAIVAGCAGGTFENIMMVRSIMSGHISGGDSGNDSFSFSIYPGSQPILLELSENGALSSLICQGIIIRACFCGPCFGAGDVPGNNCLSIRHTTRNFPNREGSIPKEGQIASVCLMDARSIAATALNGGYLTSAEPMEPERESSVSYHFGNAPYLARVFQRFGKPDKTAALQYGPNIADWPSMDKLGKDILLKIVSYITDPVTTTDELIPSGETSSFRSNPLKLAEFTLSRKDPAYVEKAKAVRDKRLPELPLVLEALKKGPGFQQEALQIGSAIYARKPGDGSAREQAASCQRVLGGCANFAGDYATKRYRSNLINWGILPFIIDGEPPFKNGDYVFIPGIEPAIRQGLASITAYTVTGSGGDACAFTLKVPELNASEKALILAGSLINHNRTNKNE
jgi:aconitate hydratase